MIRQRMLLLQKKKENVNKNVAANRISNNKWNVSVVLSMRRVRVCVCANATTSAIK